MSAYLPLTLSGIVQANAARTPEKTALLFEGANWTYRDLARRIARIGNAALAMGIKPGDKVLLSAINSPDYMMLVLGLSGIGAAVVTPSAQLAPAELDLIINDCKPVLTIGEADAFSSIPHLTIGRSLDAVLERARDRLLRGLIDEADTFAITYTSGTTGSPKGVMLSHRSRVLTALAMANEYRCFGPDHRFLAATPLCHGAGFAYAVTNLLLGGAVELMRGFKQQDFMSSMAAPETTGIFLVPTMLHRLIDADARVGAQCAGIICNAAALPQPLKETAVNQLGNGLLHETYGSTEAGIVTNLQPRYQTTTKNSCGRPFWNVEVEIRGEDSRSVENGVVGELFSRGPYGFSGYLNNSGATREAVHHGWISVGDMAIRDDHGFVQIVDRKSDMIVTGGINVYPREVENVILDFDGISETAVFGITDRKWGEAIHAAIVRKPGLHVSIMELEAFCRSRLAAYKIPKTWLTVDQLPKNGSGKLLRRQLKLQVEQTR